MAKEKQDKKQGRKAEKKKGKKQKAAPAAERVMTIPLRKEWVKQGTPRRANRSINVIRETLGRHLHVDDVRLSAGVNDQIWARGNRKPPARIRVAVTVEEGVARARLPEEKLPLMEKAKETKVEKVKPETPQGGAEKAATDKTAPAAEKAAGPPKTAPTPETAKKKLTPEEEAAQLWKEAEQQAK
ncbi:MAG: 60S ribosomal protein L31 [Candidatus Aenigmarchaeota archaeon]|nr:60S ribosomal protein L31 [Candidatus Aenigmarchaeota archaeon]